MATLLLRLLLADLPFQGVAAAAQAACVHAERHGAAATMSVRHHHYRVDMALSPGSADDSSASMDQAHGAKHERSVRPNVFQYL